MEHTVRLATPADASALARLRYEFRASLSDPVESEADFLARATPWMAARLALASAWLCFVLESKSAPGILGTLWLQRIEKLPNPTPEREAHAYITSVYVHPSARGGSGQLLLQAALDWCRENAIDAAILWPTPGSRTLYERHGFAVRDDLMEAILDPARIDPDGASP